MGISETGGRMEGWLCTIRSNRFGQQFARKRYFTLKDNNLLSYKDIPSSEEKEPVRSAVIDTRIRVTDNGRESIQKKVLFVFTFHNTSDKKDKLKLGASSSEEAAKWIHSLQDAALKECPELQIKTLSSASKRRWPSLRLCSSKHQRASSVDWNTVLSLNIETTKPDVIAPSPWKIFSCQNGLRVFKESKDGDSHGTYWDDHPAIMAVGVVYGTSEDIFSTLMTLGSSRSEWDYCLHKGSVVEHIDGNTDIIHKELHGDWLPWRMKRRDLLLQRCWRREDDGTYVILYHSVSHEKCQPQSGYVRASLKSGGYVITPVHEGKQSLVKHMLSVDWKFWNLYLRPSASRALTIRMLERISALRELFKTKQDTCPDKCSSAAGKMDIGLLQTVHKNKTEFREPEEIKELKEENIDGYDEKKMPRRGLISLNDSSDEFFDVPESTESTDNEWPSEGNPEGQSQSLSQPKVSAAGLVKRLHDFASELEYVQKKGYVDLQDIMQEDCIRHCYGTTLQKDVDCSLPCTWSEADPSSFLIRGKSYLEDNKKTKAKRTLMQMIGADWLGSDKREDDLGSRLGGIVQESAARGGPEFYFIVNIQVPGTTTYTLALYYVLKSPLEDHPLLKRFVDGDDAFRNSRFKLIPYISQGSCIVKQSVGKKACLVGQALEVHYFRGQNYLELEIIDVGSSTVARGVVSLVLGDVNNLVIEMAFLIQGNTQEELPEFLLGTCRLNHLDASKCAPREEMP